MSLYGGSHDHKSGGLEPLGPIGVYAYVHIPNDISIGSSVFARHTATDLQASFWGPPEKKTNYPPSGCQICALNLFVDRDNELQINDGNFLSTDNKHRKLFLTEHSKVCKFMPKMYQNTLGGRALPGPAGVAYALSQTP